MGRTGAPSKACQTCKTRKIKCDEGKPSCYQCVKTSRVCPGYSDVIFRNQTEAVKRKQQLPKKQRPQSKAFNARLPKSAECDEESSGTSTALVRRRQSFTSDDVSRELKSRFGQLRVYSSSESIRPPPWLSIQEQAVNICFKNFDTMYGVGYDDGHNILHALAPLYQASSEGSPLRVSLHAVALSALSMLSSKRILQHQAALAYGKAIKTMSTALLDTTFAQKDETLLAALVLSWYETINASDGSMRAWSSHIDGAAAILKMRGSSQFHDPLGLVLFRQVRTEMFINCLRSGTAPEDFPEQGGWLSDTHLGTYDYRDPVHDLMHHAVELPTLLQIQKEIMRHAPDTEALSDMQALVGRARQVEKAMADTKLPDEFRPRTIGYIADLPEDIDTATAWVGPVYDYRDVYVASALNKIHSCRILAAKIMTTGIMWMYPVGYSQKEEYRHATYIQQRATDEICSSVPLHFRWGKRNGEHLNSSDEEMNHTVDLVVGYLLHWPLRVARTSDEISTEQKRWIDRQLNNVGERCGVRQATVFEVEEDQAAIS
ncbi:hypothetical protein AAFC00_006040 [Neodothiora populina]|uniref:Zn(2)-C6 fungal-type domain-containing protein n=1 Tax=Neodothiora populina TaxID=2781224 RepID=A0ABR3P836_9PEZI